LEVLKSSHEETVNARNQERKTNEKKIEDLEEEVKNMGHFESTNNKLQKLYDSAKEEAKNLRIERDSAKQETVT